MTEQPKEYGTKKAHSLSQDEIDQLYDLGEEFKSTGDLAIRAATEIQVLRADLDSALTLLAEWVMSKTSGDEDLSVFARASYQDGPLRELIDKKICGLSIQQHAPNATGRAEYFLHNDSPDPSPQEAFLGRQAQEGMGMTFVNELMEQRIKELLNGPEDEK